MEKSQAKSCGITNLFDSEWWKKATDTEITSAIASAEVLRRDYLNRTALMFAAKLGSKDNINSLLNAGADIHAHDDRGWTALFWATLSDKPENIELLITSGADLHVRDKDGMKAFDHAQRNVEFRGTQELFCLAGEPNAKNMPFDQILESILIKSKSEGLDMSWGGIPDYERIELVFDENLRPIVTTQQWFKELKELKTERIIAARIDKPSLMAIRRSDISRLNTTREVEQRLDKARIFEYVKEFMRNRLKANPPYYGVISGLSFLGMENRYAFKIYPVKNLEKATLTQKVREHFSSDLVVAVHDQAISVTFSHKIGHYLSEKDEKLINFWEGRKLKKNQVKFISRSSMTIDYTQKKYMRLICARLAEKFAISLYSSLQEEPVEDCSLGQLDNKDKRWIDFDVWAGRPIDVKNVTVYQTNARQNFVPKFKRSGGRAVSISAFATLIGRSGNINQRFLGEVSEVDLDLARSAVERAFPMVGPIQVRFDDEYLPGWVFESPFHKLDYDELLQAYILLAERPESILAAAVAGEKVEEISVYAKLTPFQKTVLESFRRVISESSFSKRAIVLFGVSGFSAEIISGGNPQKFISFYRKLFQLESLKPSYIGSRSFPGFSGSRSGGLSDPLNSVDNMLNILEIAAKEIVKSRHVFTAFHAPNPYILIGRLRDKTKLTIYAYCGGTFGGSRCDSFPLVIGANATCQGCGKLICQECGYCSASCSKSGSHGND